MEEEHKWEPKVGVIVATFGDKKKWKPLAQSALSSIDASTDIMMGVYSHSNTLADARNGGVDVMVDSVEWLIFLDADDELSPGYVDTMLEAAKTAPDASIFKPATLGVYSDGYEDDNPVMIPRRNLLKANHIVIGAMVRRDMFMKAGGFRELPALEDWDLWLRLALEFDAKIVEVPGAVYRVHVHKNSRNQNVEAHRAAYLDIIARTAPIARARGIREL